MSVLAWERPLKPVQTTMFSRSVVVVLATVGVGSTASAQCLRYTIELIPGPNCQFVGSTSFAFGMNGDGELCGGYTPCSKSANGSSVWLGQGGWVNVAQPPGREWFRLYDITSSRSIAGSSQPLTESFPRRAVRYDFVNNVFIDIGLLPGFTNSEAVAINENGWVCGYLSGVNSQAFIWQDNRMALLNLPIGPNSMANDISDSGLVCGWMGQAWTTIASAFIYDSSTGETVNVGTPLPGTTNADATAVNSLGNICGRSGEWCGEFAFCYRGFFWSKGNVQELGVLPGFDRCIPKDLNDSNIVVGFCDTHFGNTRAFVWRNGVMYRLSDLVYPPQPTLNIREATAINNAGQIAGQAGIPGGNAAVRLTPIPPTLGDCNCDQRVNVNDLLNVIYAWHTPGTPNAQGGSADLNQDKTVNVDDQWIVLNNWTS